MKEQPQMVTLKIESAIHGHETVVVPVEAAISRIDQEKGKWLYCDGQYVNTDTATGESRARLAETLRHAQDIVLAGTLLGG